MENSRRSFLQAAGLTLLGVGSGTPLILSRRVAQRPAPAPPQAKGKHWAMVIDTRKCAREEGCRDCIDACHSGHNVPHIADPEEEVKWIWKEHLDEVFPERINAYTDEAVRERETLVLCNNCDDPPCVRVCPTQATWKREDGPVMMDMHRCIGCRYCIVGCPYGARSFNWRDPRKFLDRVDEDFPTRTKGVVEKCTLCAERLRRGERPLCVEACERRGTRAIVFGDLNDPDSEIHRIVASGATERRRPELGTRPQVHYLL